jgi:hypothetical protein
LEEVRRKGQRYPNAASLAKGLDLYFAKLLAEPALAFDRLPDEDKDTSLRFLNVNFYSRMIAAAEDVKATLG